MFHTTGAPRASLPLAGLMEQVPPQPSWQLLIGTAHDS